MCTCVHTSPANCVCRCEYVRVFVLLRPNTLRMLGAQIALVCLFLLKNSWRAIYVCTQRFAVPTVVQHKSAASPESEFAGHFPSINALTTSCSMCNKHLQSWMMRLPPILSTTPFTHSFQSASHSMPTGTQVHFGHPHCQVEPATQS